MPLLLAKKNQTHKPEKLISKRRTQQNIIMKKQEDDYHENEV